MAMSNGDLMCHICDKGGNTVVTTGRGNKIIPYYDLCRKVS